MRRLWLCFAFEAFKGLQVVWFITLLALRRPLNDIQVIVTKDRFITDVLGVDFENIFLVE